MIELTGLSSVTEVTKELLDKYSILVKDLSQKLHGKQYMRIAIRNREDNDRFAEALNNVVNHLVIKR